MILREIRCAGFRGIREPLELRVPEGFLVLTGRNGAGKSSVCDAVEFALTGSLRRHAEDSERQERIDDYVWWRGAEPVPEPYVSLVFSMGGEEEVTVTRTPQGLESPASEDDLLETFCSPEQAPSDPMRRLLGSAIIRDEEITQLSIDLPERERFKFVRAAIGETELPIYIERLKKAHAGLEAIWKERVAEYESAREKVNDLIERIAETQAHLARIEDLKEAETALSQYMGEVTGGDSLLPAARAKVVELRYSADRIRELADELQQLEDRMSGAALEEHARRKAELVSQIEEQKLALEACSREQQGIDAALEEFGKDSTDLGSKRDWAEVLVLGETLGLRDGHCPLCGSEIGEAEFSNHIQEALTIIRKRDETVSRLTKERFAVRERHRKLEAELKESQVLLEQHERADSTARKRIEVVSTQARKLGFDREGVTSSALQSVGEQRREEARRVERWAMLLETSSEVDDLAMLRDRLAEARKEQSRVEESVSAADHARERAKDAHNAVRRIEREVIDERLAALGPLLEELYLRLKPHLDWPSVRYRLRGDVRHYLSLEVGDELNPRFMFSSGQRRAMGIAFLLAAYLSSSWTRLRTLILDDPVQHVDDFRALHLAEVLNGIRKQGRQIICSAEDPELARLIARRLRGIRNEAGALVELEYQLGTGVSVERYELMNPASQRVLESA